MACTTNNYSYVSAAVLRENFGEKAEAIIKKYNIKDDIDNHLDRVSCGSEFVAKENLKYKTESLNDKYKRFVRKKWTNEDIFKDCHVVVDIEKESRKFKGKIKTVEVKNSNRNIKFDYKKFKENSKKTFKK